MKFFRGLALALGILALPAAANAQQTLTFGGSDAIGSLLDRQNALFAKLVNERAAGKLKINFIQGEQLGNDQQVIEQMIAGSVHIYGDVLDWYANWVKDFAIMGWGFTFRDTDHLQKFTESAAYQKLAEELRAKQGIRILAAAATQPRVLFANKKIAGLADISGIKMRVPEIKVYVKLWETLGARPSRLAWAEVFLGLKNGVVDAAEGPVSAAFAAKFHEAVKHVMRTDHIYSSAHITINDKAFMALSPELQKIVIDAAREAVAWSRAQAARETDEVLAKMAAAGATIHKIDAAAIRAKSEAAVAEMEKDGAWSAGLWKAIQDIK
ncbi:MAG TPA: TRAP transporter substrate-binding protein [Hyphomicrobiaceae bacterium]|nr:TRAP transporter substrate-binding protein [Hyphomicrobiaceae bacterium]